LLPKTLTALTLGSFKTRGYHHHAFVPEFISALEPYRSLTDLTLANCDDHLLRLLIVSEGLRLCPLMQKLRVEGKVCEDVLKLIAKSRSSGLGGSLLKRIELSNRQAIQLDSVLAIMDLVDELWLDGVEVEEEANDTDLV